MNDIYYLRLLYMKLSHIRAASRHVIAMRYGCSLVDTASPPSIVRVYTHVRQNNGKTHAHSSSTIVARQRITMQSAKKHAKFKFFGPFRHFFDDCHPPNSSRMCDKYKITRYLTPDLVSALEQQICPRPIGLVQIQLLSGRYVGPSFGICVILYMYIYIVKRN